jgi:pyruvate dehydrogenase E1 component
MFGFQRVGDMIWAFGDQRGRGFLLGATSGRTTLMGEGLQHQDGHSHILASTVPNLYTYDPAYAYEVAVIIQDGMRRMYQEREDIFYYITLGNENYTMPAMPEGAEEGILKGLYRLAKGPTAKGKVGFKGHILASGSIVLEALRAQEILAEKFSVSADVWSATSFKELRRDALGIERWNLLHPDQKPRKPFITKSLEKEKGVFVAATDYMKTVAAQVCRWVPGGLFPLGTDGFGRSDTREALRKHFEVNAEMIALAVLYQLHRKEDLEIEVVMQAFGELGIDPEKADPLYI